MWDIWGMCLVSINNYCRITITKKQFLFCPSGIWTATGIIRWRALGIDIHTSATRPTHGSRFDPYCKQDIKKNSTLKLPIPHISAQGKQIIKILVSTPNNTTLIVGGRHTNSNGLMLSGWDTRIFLSIALSVYLFLFFKASIKFVCLRFAFVCNHMGVRQLP